MTIHNSIILPTRVTDKSKTLINNIFFDSFEFTSFSGNIMHSISDNLIQVFILEDFLIPKQPPKSNAHKKSWIILIAIN